MGNNPNHPAKGSRITVDPIRNLKDIKSIKKLLADNPRDLALFVLGVNTNLRASDLIRLTAGQVRNLKVGDDLVLTEKKTGKERRITVNPDVVNSVQNLIKSHALQDNEPLFTSRKGGALTVPSVNRLVKSWAASINLQGNYGSHSLRKTWGFHMRVTFKTDLSLLTECFNHSSQKITLGYLGIQPEEIKAVYMKCIG